MRARTCASSGPAPTSRNVTSSRRAAMRAATSSQSARRFCRLNTATVPTTRCARGISSSARTLPPAAASDRTRSTGTPLGSVTTDVPRRKPLRSMEAATSADTATTRRFHPYVAALIRLVIG
jgi:hypothetical protein